MGRPTWRWAGPCHPSTPARPGCRCTSAGDHCLALWRTCRTLRAWFARPRVRPDVIVPLHPKAAIVSRIAARTGVPIPNVGRPGRPLGRGRRSTRGDPARRRPSHGEMRDADIQRCPAPWPTCWSRWASPPRAAFVIDRGATQPTSVFVPAAPTPPHPIRCRPSSKLAAADKARPAPVTLVRESVPEAGSCSPAGGPPIAR
jgi:hypothetical protein